MRIIGITGRSGSGKSTVAALYRSLGYTVADADRVARQVLCAPSPCLPRLAAAFGADILNEQGEVDRPLLAQRAYRDAASTRALVDITHPEIVARLLREAQAARQAGADLFFVDGAVIVGAPFEQYCDGIVLVRAPYRQSLGRICTRDGLTRRQAATRLAAQLPVRKLRAAAAWEICNDQGPEHLRAQALAVLNSLKGGG